MDPKLLTKLQQISEQKLVDIEVHKDAGNHVDGVVDLTRQARHTCNIEAFIEMI